MEGVPGSWGVVRGIESEHRRAEKDRDRVSDTVDEAMKILRELE